MASLKKRNGIYYAQLYIGGRQVRRTLKTDSLQIAKAKLREIENTQAQGNGNPLPTRTPIGKVVEQYVEHIRTVKTAKSAQTDVYYLREAFGECCEAVRITSRNPSAKTRKRPVKEGGDRRRRARIIEANHFEAITTADIQQFIDSHVRSRGLAPKTANRYREIVCRLFNWSMDQGIIRMPGNINPATKVERHREHAPQIRYLSLTQIDEQLDALRFKPQMQKMVATLIYAGLRREELLWLTLDDVDLSRRHGGHGLIRLRAKTIDGRFWEPKTKVNRVVPISRALRSFLDRYSPPATHSPKTSDSFRGWFFPSPMGCWWDGDGFSRDLRRVNKDLSLQWGCLDYRHTFGSQLAQNGVSLFKVSSLMGNSPEICRRHYASLAPETMLSEIEFPGLSPKNLHPQTEMSNAIAIRRSS
ncbi:tyrosine-type recombinase/integrase [Algisphaera agarilytica]|uniref:Integrase n=1 Tax=Algisphaera agarilytica TaxID=1385975 RepID=A0A7X0H931_9BACT|nr:tyrosine-type recombinase/integrase [Algisphaera agarilytica]MBB6431383.1 integrase [Algisphaera agarilytica]